jgi:hypothetical protein
VGRFSIVYLKLALNFVVLPSRHILVLRVGLRVTVEFYKAKTKVNVVYWCLKEHEKSSSDISQSVTTYVVGTLGERNCVVMESSLVH